MFRVSEHIYTSCAALRNARLARGLTIDLPEREVGEPSSAAPIDHEARPYQRNEKWPPGLKETAAALRRSEERYRAFVESSDDVIFQCSPQGRILFINAAGAQLFGRPPEEIQGHDIHKIVRPEVLDAALQHLQLILQSRHREIAEFTGTMEGHLRVFFTSVVPLFDAHGEVESVIGMARDITDQRRTEQVLLKKEMLLREAGRMARVGGWECALRELNLILSEDSLPAAPDSRGLRGQRGWRRVVWVMTYRRDITSASKSAMTAAVCLPKR